MGSVSFVASVDAALHHAEELHCGPFRDLCDAFDSLSGATVIGACALLLLIVAAADRVFNTRISNR